MSLISCQHTPKYSFRWILMMWVFLVLMIAQPIYAKPKPMSEESSKWLPRPWIRIWFKKGEFKLECAPGDTSASDSLGYQAIGNTDATISLDVKPPLSSRQYPWDWKGSVKQSRYQARTLHRDTATVTVSGITGQEVAQTYSGGLAIITITSVL